MWNLERSWLRETSDQSVHPEHKFMRFGQASKSRNVRAARLGDISETSVNSYLVRAARAALFSTLTSQLSIPHLGLLESEVSHVVTRSFQSRPVANETAARRAWLVAAVPDGLDRPVSFGPFLHRSG
jgi:hypothetical protein